MARPLVDEIEGRLRPVRADGPDERGATLSPTIRDRLLAAVPNLMIMDAVGASESGAQMTTIATKGADVTTATFTALADTAVVSLRLHPCVAAGRGGLAGPPRVRSAGLSRRRRKNRAHLPPPSTGCAGRSRRQGPLSRRRPYRTAGPRLGDHQPGGEKIFAEEVEQCGGQSPGGLRRGGDGPSLGRWGSEVVAVVQFAQGRTATDAELAEACRQHIADYKVPKAFIRTDHVVRSPPERPITAGPRPSSPRRRTRLNPPPAPVDRGRCGRNSVDMTTGPTLGNGLLTCRAMYVYIHRWPPGPHDRLRRDVDPRTGRPADRDRRRPAHSGAPAVRPTTTSPAAGMN